MSQPVDFRFAVGSWLDFRARGWTGDRTAHTFRGMVGPWITVLGDLPMDAIGPVEIQRLYLERDDPVRGRSPHTLNAEKTNLSAFFSWAMGLGMCKASPITRHSWPRKDVHKPGKRSRRHVSIDPKLLRKILDLAPLRYHRFLVFLFLLGLRIGEGLAARWSWVLADPRHPGNWVLSVPGYARKQRRGYIAPISERCMSYLGKRGPEDEAIFPEAPTASGVRQMLTAIGKKLGLPGLAPHQFRRSCATQLVNSGMPLPAVQAVMGWRTPPQEFLDMLQDSYYLGLEGDRAREIQDRLGPPASGSA
jgi:integrase